MTPEQLDHLRAIDAHLDALLALAAKRTPGEWHSERGNDLVYRNGWIIAGAFEGEYVTTDCPIIPDEERHTNAAFISACAGRAEAGWRATKAAISALGDTEAAGCPFSKRVLETILAEWPLESLTLP